MKKINFNNSVERNFHDISEDKVEYFNQNKCDLYYTEENGMYLLYVDGDLVDEGDEAEQLEA